MKSKIIAIDFDGTLAEHMYPSIGLEVPGAIATCLELQAAGHRLILYTMRSNYSKDGNTLDEAIDWCRAKGLEFWAVGRNPEQESWTNAFKCYAQAYIDDNAIGCPLRKSIRSERMMVDWIRVRELLVEREFLV